MEEKVVRIELGGPMIIAGLLLILHYFLVGFTLPTWIVVIAWLFLIVPGVIIGIILLLALIAFILAWK